MTSLIEKLADSKVVIRQAVLKCCVLLIVHYKTSVFGIQAVRYLQHGNWHVREGVTTLIAHCIIHQTNCNFYYHYGSGKNAKNDEVSQL